ncbi:MAG: TraR/DksA family transcriptional regulator [Anaerolineae bacterium]
MDTSTVQKVETLIGQRNDILEEIEHLRLALSAEVDPTEDEADPEIVEREKTLAVLRAFERKLDEIDLALRAAEAGAYGICEVCGQPIDPARLKIVPEATMCVRCKSATERRIRR